MRATFGAPSPASSVTCAPHWPVSEKLAGVTQMPLLAPPTLRKTAAPSTRFSACPLDSSLKNSTLTLPVVIG